MTSSNCDLLLDIRTKEEWKKGHAYRSILIETPLPPLSDANILLLREKLIHVLLHHKLFCNKNARIAVYCKKGVRSKIATNILRRLGFHNVTNLGGIENRRVIADTHFHFDL